MSVSETRPPSGPGRPPIHRQWDNVDEARLAIVAAARRCFSRYGVQRTTMEDIGKEAGIPRSYLYRFVSGRDELVISVVFQLTKDIVGKYEPLLIQAPSFAVGLTDMAIEAVHGMRNDPELENLLETTPGMGLPELFVGPGAMNIQLGLGFLAPALEKARQNGKLRDDVTDSEIIEWLISVLLMMILRHDLDVERERAMIRRFVLPGLSPWAAECDVS